MAMLVYQRVGSWEQNHNLCMVFIDPCSVFDAKNRRSTGNSSSKGLDIFVY